ncbi:hypothetical protein LX32DRAFT_121970 [Colletotrichum zoysiae]|uniref:Uncharacterized protein n=1 Tax=Colletotrichum zoysiae TaxID=1216348 RepID=A0AAD9LX27_9PEZI|nr:hypothetical protein LX32DRAFT_121970 [Colletotrichum zoysiae]
MNEERTPIAASVPPKSEIALDSGGSYTTYLPTYSRHCTMLCCNAPASLPFIQKDRANIHFTLPRALPRPRKALSYMTIVRVSHFKATRLSAQPCGLSSQDHRPVPSSAVSGPRIIHPFITYNHIAGLAFSRSNSLITGLQLQPLLFCLPVPRVSTVFPRNRLAAQPAIRSTAVFGMQDNSSHIFATGKSPRP